jgi:serine/threonine-protein kinase
MQGRIFLNRYEILRQLGEGGMGRVYLARQLDLPRQVVIKVMHPHIAADPRFTERFQREMAVMCRFQHPYAVPLYDASPDTPEGPCIIMEYARGETLEVILEKNGRISPPRVGRILGQLSEALQAAHNLGILHRDLKPANIMVLDADTPYETIKVLDFGLAKLVDGTNIRKMSDSGSEFMIGTPGYMPPEMARGEPVDHRGDIYSMGVILYEMLSGILPFRGMPTMDLLMAHATEPPPPLCTKELWVPPEIESVVLQCLAKKAEDRPNSAWSVAKLYEAALHGESAIGRKAEEATPSRTNATDPATTQLMPRTNVDDPNLVVFQLQAYVPESIASYKLKGFIEDAHGEVIENVPGKIRVRFGGRGCRYGGVEVRSSLAWLGIGTHKGKPLEMELLLAQEEGQGRGRTVLTITAMIRNLARAADPQWKSRAEQIIRDLRAYLIGSTMQVIKA